MVTEEVKAEHRYIQRSCTNCVSKRCRIKDNVFHPSKPHSNCAKYGCVRYEGEFINERRLTDAEISNNVKSERRLELSRKNREKYRYGLAEREERRLNSIKD